MFEVRGILVCEEHLFKCGKTLFHAPVVCVDRVRRHKPGADALKTHYLIVRKPHLNEIAMGHFAVLYKILQ